MNLRNQKTQWRRVLADLYSGHKGTFLTAYLPTPTSNQAFQWRNQIESVVANTERLMKRNHSPEAIEEYLRPVRRLAHETQLLETSGRGGWVLFRSESQFRIKRLHNMNIEPLSVVSSSFHIKPLLKWWEQTDGYYVLNINSEEAKLFERTGAGLKTLDSLPTLGGPLYNWLDTWVMENMDDSNRPLILSGEPWAIKSFLENSEYTNIFPRSVIFNDSKLSAAKLLEEVEECLIEEAMDFRHQTKRDLLDASKTGSTSFDIRRIARTMVNGNVSRLYLAEDAHVWGVFDRTSGDLKVHSNQLDCRDDDILDDLAELAMKKGVDVVLLPKSDIPTGSPVAAIFKTSAEAQKVKRAAKRPEHVAS